MFKVWVSIMYIATCRTYFWAALPSHCSADACPGVMWMHEIKASPLFVFSPFSSLFVRISCLFPPFLPDVILLQVYSCTSAHMQHSVGPFGFIVGLCWGVGFTYLSKDMEL